MRLALDRGEFELVYQPQFGLATGHQCGFEALIRWHHPVHGKIAPADFIAVAEDTGLIVPIGEWVLHRACSDAVNWLWLFALGLAVRLGAGFDVRLR